MSGRPEPASVQAVLEELLGALGFGAMAKQAGAETDPEKLQLYARIIVKQAPVERKPAIIARLRLLQLL